MLIFRNSRVTMTPKSHFVRTNDHDNFSGKNRKDFIIRDYGLSTMQMRVVFMGGLLLLAGMAILVYYRLLLWSALYLVSGTVTLIGIVLVVFAERVENREHIWQGAEFLNALFASALSAGYRFSLIVEQETGTIVYMDRAFQQLFPEATSPDQRNLADLMSIYSMKESDRQRLREAIHQSSANQVPFAIETGADKKRRNMTVTVEPISRPAGFCLLRGRDQ
jgi:hypothetical protein